MDEMFREILELWDGTEPDYTLLLDSCRYFIKNGAGTRRTIVRHILEKSAQNVYMPYGALCWYIPEYELYEPLVMALQDLLEENQNKNIKDRVKLNAFALVRDVCHIYKQVDSVWQITEETDGELLRKWAGELARVSKSRAALCELFYLGDTDEQCEQVYPRCFDVSECKALKAFGRGTEDIRTVCFRDELKLYQSEMLSRYRGECTGLVSVVYTGKGYSIIKDLEEMQQLREMRQLEANRRRDRNYPAGADRPFSKLEQIKTKLEDRRIDRVLLQTEKDMKQRRQAAIKESERMEEQLRGACRINGIIFCGSLMTTMDMDYVDFFRKNIRAFYVPENCRTFYDERDNFNGGMTLHYGGEEIPFTAWDAHLDPSGMELFVDMGRYYRKHALIAEGVSEIKEEAFRNFDKLESVRIPPGVKKIQKAAFAGCVRLREITLPEGVTELGEKAFYGCAHLESIIIPEGVTKIQHGTFEYCSRLKEVRIPQSVTTIGEFAFAHCVSLKKIMIPDSVKEVAKFAFHDCNLEEVIAPEHLREVIFGKNSKNAVIAPGTVELGPRAYEDYRALETIEFPKGLEKIGAYAFHDCVSLKEVEFPDSIREIGESSFRNCSSLRHMDTLFSEKIGSCAFFDCSSLERVDLQTSLREIGSQAFRNCRSLKKIAVPPGVSVLKSYVFEGCSSLEEVTLYRGLREIDRGAFKDCVSLKRIVIPDSVRVLAEDAFEGCSSLTEIIAPEWLLESKAITSIVGNSTKKEAVIRDGVTVLEARSFAKYRALETVVFPQGLKEIGDFAFSGCSSLKKVVLPQGVENISEGAFADCAALETLELPDSVRVIETHAFQGCSNLRTIVFPEEIEYIADGAFENCGGLTEVRISEFFREELENIFGSAVSASLQVTFIREHADSDMRFDESGCTEISSGEIDCPRMRSAVFGEEITTINIKDHKYLKRVTVLGERVEYVRFENCAGLEEVELPRKGNDPSFYFTSCCSLRRITLPEGLMSVCSEAFRGCTGLEAVMLPDSIQYIFDEAFRGCESLKTISLPEGLCSIGKMAFCDCASLEAINLPGSLRMIEGGAFSGCRSLKTITIPEGLIVVPNKNGTKVFGVFTNCPNLERLVFAEGTIEIDEALVSKEITEVILPKSTRRIKPEAFSGCGRLEKVNIPEEVEEIGREAFARCVSLRELDLSHVKTVAMHAFGGCLGLQRLILPQNANWSYGERLRQAFAGVDLRQVEMIRK